MLGTGQAALADALQHAIATPQAQEAADDAAPQDVQSAEDAVAALLAEAQPSQMQEQNKQVLRCCGAGSHVIHPLLLTCSTCTPRCIMMHSV